MGVLNIVVGFLDVVARSRGRTALLIGAAAMLPVAGTGGFVVANWLDQARLSSMQERLDSANQRAATAETMSAADSKAASQLKLALAKSEEENSTLKTQLQGYQKADEIRKKNAALQKQTAAKRPKTPILSDLFAEDEFYIMGHNRRILIMDRRYTIVASPSFGPLLGSGGCTLTVANVDRDGDEKFDFVEGKSGLLSVGEATVSLILVSAQSFGPRSNVCVFQQRQ